MSDVKKLENASFAGYVPIKAGLNIAASVITPISNEAAKVESIESVDLDSTLSNEVIQLTKTEYQDYLNQYTKELEGELSEYQNMLDLVAVELEELEVFSASFNEANMYYEQYELDTESRIFEIVNNYRIMYCSDEKLEELGITAEELQSMDFTELLELCKKKDSAVKQEYQNLEQYKVEILDKKIQEESGFKSYAEYAERLADLKKDQAVLEVAVNKTKEAIACAPYAFLPYLEDYQNYSYEEVSIKDLQTKDVSPLETFRALNQVFSRYNIAVDRIGEIEALLKASEENPELAKMYNYLYEKEGLESANAYLTAIEGTVNQVNGQVQAERFLEKLKDEENVGDAITNHLKTTGKGLLDGTESFFDGVAAWFKSSDVYTANEYETMYILDALQNNEKYNGLLDNNYEISQSIGNMLPSMLLSAVATPMAGTISMGVSAGGNSYHQGLVEGQGVGKSLVYGVLSGVSEATLERCLGGIPGLSDVKVTGLKTFAQSMLKEGVEEGTQEYVDALMRAGIFDEEVDIEEVTKNAGKSAIYGAITGGILNTPSLIINTSNINTVNKALDAKTITEADVKEYLKANQIDVTGLSTAEIVANNAAILAKMVDKTTLKAVDSVNNDNNLSLNNLKYNNTGKLTALGNLLLSNMKRYVYTNTNNVNGLNEKIVNEGLYNFRSEKTTDKILDSEHVIRASGINTSYGTPKCFFFVGIPEVGAFATNIDTVPLTATAVKVDVDINTIQDSKFKVRNLDDGVVSHEGNFDIRNQKASKEYFILVQEKDELVYKPVSKEIYDNYANTEEGKRIESFISNKTNVQAIKNDYLNTLANKPEVSQILTEDSTNIDQENILIEEIDVQSLASESNTMSREFNENSTYSGYNYLYRVDNELQIQKTIGQIKSKNDVINKYLIEVDSMSTLTSDIVNQIPENVEVRVIGAYTSEYMNGMKSPNGTQARQQATYNVQELTAIMKEIETFESGIDSNWNDYEKAHYAYEYLKDNITYVANPGPTNTRGKQFDGLMGLVNRESTCIGYAYIYKELLNRMGIDCTVIGGKLNGTGQHGWTVVKIGNDIFLVDPVKSFLNGNLNGFGVEDISVYSPRNNYELQSSVNINNDRLMQNIRQTMDLSRTEEITLIDDVAEEEFRAMSGEAENLLDEWYGFTNRKEQDNFIVKKLSDISQVSKEAKKQFINQLIETGEINNLENGTIYNMMQDEDLLHALVNTSKIEKVLEKNLVKLPQLITTTLQKLDPQEFHKIFNSIEMQNCFQNMSPTEFANVMKNLRTNSNAFLNDTILNKIVSLPIDDFYSFVNNNSYYFMESISKISKGYISIDSYDHFIGEVLKKYYTEEYAFAHPKKAKTMDFLLGTLPLSLEYNTHNVSTLSQVIDNVKTTLNGKIKTHSNLNVETNAYECNIIHVDKPGWYNIEIEIDGKSTFYSVVAKRQNEVELTFINYNEDLELAFLRDQAHIKSCNWDERKSKLTFLNLKDGLYRADVEVDGIIQSYVFKANHGKLDISKSFSENQQIGNVNLIPLVSLNSKIEDVDAIYKLVGTKNGKEVGYYIRPNVYDSKMLDVDSVFLEKNLYDLKNIQIKEISFNAFDKYLFNIQKYKESQDIFSDKVYGGNQSNVWSLLTLDVASSSDTAKIESIINVMRKYFPNITEVEVMNLAKSYGHVGCAFMSFSNALVTYFENIENGAEIFKQKFGYDLYFEEDGVKNYNFESIALDCFLNWEKKDTVRDTCSAAVGLNMINRIPAYKNFLYDKNIAVIAPERKAAHTYGHLLTDLVDYYHNENTFYILNASNFDLKYIKGENVKISDDALSDATMSGNDCYNVGGHSMLITNVDQNGNIFVSSWGNQYQFSRDFLQKNDNAHAVIDSITFIMKD